MPQFRGPNPKPIDDMETPPPLPPPVPQVLTDDDEKLLKRARNAGRNLTVLAVLASLAAIGLIAVWFSSKAAQGIVGPMAGSLLLVSVGYWVLAMAARRGNPNAVGVVIVAMVFQMCLAFIFSGIAAALTKKPFQPPVGGLLIPILVLVALVNSRKVLLELKARQLWDRAFGSAKPSGSLCVIGGAFVVAGFIALNAGSYYIGTKAGEQRAAEMGQARGFIDLVQNEEKEFLTAMHQISRAPSSIESALAKHAVLEQRLDGLKKEAAGMERLQVILNTYGNAVRQWKNGLLMLKEGNPDMERMEKSLKLGDQFRTEACNDFDNRYSEKKQPAGN